MTEKKDALKSKNGKETKPPANTSVVSGLIMLVLMGLSLALGAVAGPMVISWYQENFQEQPHEMTADNHAGHDHESEISWYVCPMHPWVVQPEEGLCPICIMDLVPLDPERFSNEIVIDPVVLQNIGIRLSQVSLGSATENIRAKGTVAYDERKVTDVNLKTGGWIEKIYVNYQGARIKKGQKLLEIYSPDLLVTQKELLMFLKAPEKSGNRDLIRLARKRLKLFDITDQQIAEIEKQGQPKRTFTVYSPVTGYVMEKSVDSGAEVKPGQKVFRIGDNSLVWVMASLYEHQLPFVKLNQKVEISFSHFPGQVFTGNISYISPDVDLKTREAQVRIDLHNRGDMLKPGMFADVIIKSQGKGLETLLAPAESVIITGKRKLAFVSMGNGKFEPRNVVTGRYTNDGKLEILSGLQLGESVVVSGQFLLDSESKIRESLLKMIEGDMASGKLPQKEFGEAGKITLTTDGQKALSGTLKAYLELQETFYQNSLIEAKENVNKLSGNLRLLKTAVGSSFDELNSEESFDDLIRFSRKISSSSDVHEARVAFGHVGNILDKLLKMTGTIEISGKKVLAVRCGMFNEAPEGGIWLQTDAKVRNPFYGKGSGMASCSSEKWEYASSDSGDEVTTTPEVNQPQQKQKPGTREPLKTKEISDSGLVKILNAYLEIHSSLYLDSFAAIEAEALNICMATENSSGALLEEIHQLSSNLVAEKDLKSIRKTFGALGIALDSLLKEKGVPESFSRELVGKRCGMYPDAPKSGEWIQVKGETKNPFFGHEHMMAQCAPKEWSYARGEVK